MNSTDRSGSKFEKVLSAKDVLMLAFGAMIGWGWVISAGDWILSGGVLGAVIGFAVGGMMVFCVGLAYAELTSAMPQCGGNHVFSYRALGPNGSFICTWAIILGYVGCVCFEACALPTIIAYLYPPFLKGYLGTVAGSDIYVSWIAAAILISVFVTYVNIRGTKEAANLQNVLTFIVGAAGILLIAGAAGNGDAGNLSGQLFTGSSASGAFHSVVSVAIITPFFFIGFDVIPQTAEEMCFPLKKVGKIMMFSILFAIAFYSLVILGVGLIYSREEIGQLTERLALIPAEAMTRAFRSPVMADVLIIGGICGIATSWNSFLIGGSRSIYALAQSHMLPQCFARLHPRYKTPVNALVLIGILSCIAPFFGQNIVRWIIPAGNFGCCIAYCIVSVSFLILRKKEPDLPRPYKVKHYKIVGLLAVCMSAFMTAMYIIPGSGNTLKPQEWMIAGGWILLGIFFYFLCRKRYGDDFGSRPEI